MPTNAFAAATSDRNSFTRKWGSLGSSVDAYISGYSFIEFTYLPNQLMEAIRLGKNTQLFSDITQVRNALHSLHLSTTIPGGTMNKTEFIGLGGVRWAAPTNADYDTNFSMRFVEMGDLPVYNIIRGWFRMIRDYRFGTSLLSGSTGSTNTYSKSNYSGTMYYWTTKPDGVTVEYATCFTGVFPLKDPADLYGHDISTNDKVEIDIDFNCDWAWQEKWVYDRCAQLAQTRKNISFGSGFAGNGAIDAYRNEDGT